METKWTPGPWIAVPTRHRMSGFLDETSIFPDGLWAILPEHDTERLPIATADHGNDHHPPARKKAEYDAHLIAAAPELYEALAEDLPPIPDKLAPCHAGLVDQSECAHCQRIIRKHKALAKARGEK